MAIGVNWFRVKACIVMFGMIFLIRDSEVYGKRTAKQQVQRNLSYADGAKSLTTKAALDRNMLSLEQPASSKDIATDQHFVATVTIENREAEEERGWHPTLMKSCRLQVPDEKNILLSYHEHNMTLSVNSVDAMIPHGVTLMARCPVLGQMKLVGFPSIRCVNGKWNNRIPTCLPTTTSEGLSPFVDDHPPTIIRSIPVGAAGENAAGELVVRPGSVVHLDCIFYRRLGRPSWSRTRTTETSVKRYPMGWAMDQSERLWRFRISIFSIEKVDEGDYVCTTPRGHTNSIHIVVQCLWSEARVPVCELIQCPYDIDGADPRLEFDFLNGAGYMAMVKFSCPPGYQLIGSNNATCREDMNWFPVPPSCEAVECGELLPPLNGRIMNSGSSHFVGDTVKFSCNRNLLLVGQSEITCMEDGNWSHPTPQCQLLCGHPGDLPFGSFNPSLTSYEIGTTVHVTCQDRFILHGRQWLVCQQDGSWSFQVGACLWNEN